MSAKFLLILGPSGAGKSAIIRGLRDMDSRFVYISPFITRTLRPGESDKVSVADSDMDRMIADNRILVVNELYGIRYATPKDPIKQAFAEGKFPLLDWPIDQMAVMWRNFPGRMFAVYVRPPSIRALAQRLEKDGRDADGSRLTAGIDELRRYRAGEFRQMIDMTVVSRDGTTDALSSRVYKKYLSACR